MAHLAVACICYKLLVHTIKQVYKFIFRMISYIFMYIKVLLYSIQMAYLVSDETADPNLSEDLTSEEKKC